jgi:hypothetical protein
LQRCVEMLGQRGAVWAGHTATVFTMLLSLTPAWLPCSCNRPTDLLLCMRGVQEFARCAHERCSGSTRLWAGELRECAEDVRCSELPSDPPSAVPEVVACCSVCCSTCPSAPSASTRRRPPLPRRRLRGHGRKRRASLLL